MLLQIITKVTHITCPMFIHTFPILQSWTKWAYFIVVHRHWNNSMIRASLALWGWGVKNHRSVDTFYSQCPRVLIRVWSAHKVYFNKYFSRNNRSSCARGTKKRISGWFLKRIIKCLFYFINTYFEVFYNLKGENLSGHLFEFC